MELTYGIFARLNTTYPPEKGYAATKVVAYSLHAIAGDSNEAIESYAKHGMRLVQSQTVTFPDDSVTLAEVVKDTLKGLQHRQEELRAKCYKECADIDQQINDLLMLEAPAPVRGADDDIPF